MISDKLSANRNVVFKILVFYECFIVSILIVDYAYTDEGPCSGDQHLTLQV